MSNTFHHLNQKRSKCGYDYGAKRPGNRHYAAPASPYSKKLTHRLERAQARQEVHAEICSYQVYQQ